MTRPKFRFGLFALVAGTALILGAVACSEAAATATTSSQSPTATPGQSPTSSPTQAPSGTPPAPGDDAMAASIQNFNLPNLQITLGTTVTWTNQDSSPHTVTHGTPSAQGDDFGSTSLSQGETFSVTFDEAGRYDYFCGIHTTMTGVIVVTVSGPDTSTPAPTATSAATATTAPTSVPATAVPTEVPASPTSVAPTVTQEAAAPTATPDDGLGEQYSAEIRFFVHEVFEIPVGTTVTWTNGDNAGHTVTSGTISGGNNGGPLSSPTMVKNDTYSYTFTEPGEYQYYCIFPHNMQGKVTVVE